MCEAPGGQPLGWIGMVPIGLYVRELRRRVLLACRDIRLAKIRYGRKVLKPYLPSLFLTIHVLMEFENVVLTTTVT